MPPTNSHDGVANTPQTAPSSVTHLSDKALDLQLSSTALAILELRLHIGLANGEAPSDLRMGLQLVLRSILKQPLPPGHEDALKRWVRDVPLPRSGQ